MRSSVKQPLARSSVAVKENGPRGTEERGDEWWKGVANFATTDSNARRQKTQRRRNALRLVVVVVCEAACLCETRDSTNQFNQSIDPRHSRARGSTLGPPLAGRAALRSIQTLAPVLWHFTFISARCSRRRFEARIIGKRHAPRAPPS